MLSSSPWCACHNPSKLNFFYPRNALSDYFVPILFQWGACAGDLIAVWFYIEFCFTAVSMPVKYHVYYFCFCSPDACLVVQYELSLVATDSVNEATTKVIIHITDVNDRPPVFDRPIYETTIEEERSAGLPILLVQVDWFIHIRRKTRVYITIIISLERLGLVIMKSIFLFVLIMAKFFYLLCEYFSSSIAVITLNIVVAGFSSV